MDDNDEEGEVGGGEENWRIFLPILKKIRNIVKKFTTSVMGKAELAKHSKWAIIKDCPTRWWSTLDQVERIAQIYKDSNSTAIREVCKAREWSLKDLDLTTEDLEMVDLFLEFFKEFRSKSDILGGEKSSNIHLVYIFTKELKCHIENYVNHPILGEFSQKFLINFNKQFDFILNPEHSCDECDFQPVFLVTSILSTFYINCLTEEEKEIGFRALLQEVRKFESPKRHASAGPQKKSDFPGLKYSSKMIDDATMKHFSANGDLVERQFLSDKQILLREADIKLQEIQATEDKIFLMNEDPLQYWIDQSHKYSSPLPKVAFNMLSATPSSVPSERLFSIASLLSAGNKSNILMAVFLVLIL